MQTLKIISDELGIRQQQVQAAVQLLDEGSTVPFIARYRKEATGALDDQQLRQLAGRLDYLRELGERRQKILSNLQEQKVLTAELKQQIEQADSKTTLEDLYLPYKSKRKTKALLAREAGLEQLLDRIISKAEAPQFAAKDYIQRDGEFSTLDKVLEGVQALLNDRAITQLALLNRQRGWLKTEAKLTSKVTKGKAEVGSKFKDYFDYAEAVSKIPSHRMLALLRGEKEEILKLSVTLDDEQHFVSAILKDLQLPTSSNTREWSQEAARLCWRDKLKPKLVKALLSEQKEGAEAEAIKVFSRNLKDLLLAAPAGNKTTMGLDPGIRTGVKVAVINQTGDLLDHATIYPHAPKHQWEQSLAILGKLCRQHSVELISIGNGTASRETDKLVKELSKQLPDLNLQSLIVNEAGASVYSASELASKEFPGLDVTIRGAVSIARRVQDPLAELVKIEPKAIGVGQYQHDVNQNQLSSGLEAVIEDCVNAVGVDLNLASSAILSRISGLNSTIAQNIVDYRSEHGFFKKRSELKKVARLGPKAFEQSAAFLRINGGNQVLDSSAVHPEAYSVVEAIASQHGRKVDSLIGDKAFLQQVDKQAFVTEQFGLYTIQDALNELEKPGRDPRPEFRTANLQDGVNELSDLVEGMRLEGTISNVTNFGAFVDIGVHQDGLVHISQLADKFVKDPHDVVSAGDIVTVRVQEVDLKRKRIALSMRKQADQTPSANRPDQPAEQRQKPKQPRNTQPTNNLALAFSKARAKR